MADLDQRTKEIQDLERGLYNKEQLIEELTKKMQDEVSDLQNEKKDLEKQNEHWAS